MLNNKTAKKRIILALFSVILVVIMTVCAVQVRRKVLYDSVVGECSNQELYGRGQQGDRRSGAASKSHQ